MLAARLPPSRLAKSVPRAKTTSCSQVMWLNSDLTYKLIQSTLGPTGWPAQGFSAHGSLAAPPPYPEDQHRSATSDNQRANPELLEEAHEATASAGAIAACRWCMCRSARRSTRLRTGRRLDRRHHLLAVAILEVDGHLL